MENKRGLQEYISEHAATERRFYFISGGFEKKIIRHIQRFLGFTPGNINFQKVCLP